MQKITTFLTFNNQAEEAIHFYVSLFKNSKVTGLHRMGPDGPVMSGTFVLDGEEYYALNGGPMFTFAMGTSLFISCDTQEEVDHFWEKLSEGGEKSRCGWLKDQFGMWWQVVPKVLGQLMQSGDPAKAQRVMAAMMQMDKLVIKTLEEA